MADPYRYVPERGLVRFCYDFICKTFWTRYTPCLLYFLNTTLHLRGKEEIVQTFLPSTQTLREHKEEGYRHYDLFVEALTRGGKVRLILLEMQTYSDPFFLARLDTYRSFAIVELVK